MESSYREKMSTRGILKKTLTLLRRFSLTGSFLFQDGEYNGIYVMDEIVVIVPKAQS
jgi:hypothetical protein